MKDIINGAALELYSKQASDREKEIIADGGSMKELMQAQSERIEAYLHDRYEKQWNAFASDVQLDGLTMVEKVAYHDGEDITIRTAVIKMETGEWQWKSKVDRGMDILSNGWEDKNSDEKLATLCEFAKVMGEGSYTADEVAEGTKRAIAAGEI